MKWVAIIAIIAVATIILIYYTTHYRTMHHTPTPEYSVLSKHNNIEVRQYQPMLIAEVTVGGNRADAISSGFKILADYIFGNNRNQAGTTDRISMTTPVLQQAKSTKIAMTSPVTQQADANNQWLVRFVMPNTYTKATLPMPNNAKITIIEQPAQRRAAIRFSGNITDTQIQQHQQQLSDFIKQQNLKTKGQCEYAFYNPPWTLPQHRRNEIMITLVD